MAKVLGVYMQDNLRWDSYIDELTKKASQCLYFLIQLKRAGASADALLTFYKAHIRAVLEYSSELRHPGLTIQQTNTLEGIQKRAMKIIERGRGCNTVPPKCQLQTLQERRTQACRALFDRMRQEGHPLNKYLVPKEQKYNFRNKINYNTPKLKTERGNTSLINFCLYNFQ